MQQDTQLNVEQAIATVNQANQMVEEHQETIKSVNQSVNTVNSTINTVLEKKEELEKTFNMLQSNVSSRAASTLSSFGLDEKFAAKYKLKSVSDMMNSIQNIIPPAVLYGSVMRKPMLTQFGGLLGMDYETLEMTSMYAFFFLLPFALFVSFSTSQEKARVDDELSKSNSSHRRHQKVSLVMSVFRTILCGLAYVCYELFVGHVPTEVSILKSHLSLLVFVTFSMMAGYEWLDTKIDQFALKYMSSLVKKQE